MQIKTIMRYYLTLIRMATIKKNKQKVTSVGKDVKKSGPLCTIGGTVKCYNHYKKHYGASSKN